MRRIAMPALLLCLAAPGLASAQSLRSLEVSVEGQGPSKRECGQQARRTEGDQVLREVMRFEGVHESTASCVAKQPLVEVRRRGDAVMTTGDRCTVDTSVRYDLAQLRRTATACLRTDVSAPVGIVLRAVRAESKAETPDEALGDRARADISSALARANFRIVDVPAQLQTEYLDLKGTFGACAITGAVEDAGWRERCQTQFTSVGHAREAVADKLRQALAVLPDLGPWKDCRGLFVIGGVRMTKIGNTLQGDVDASYYVLVDGVTFIAPFSESRSMKLDPDAGRAVADERFLAAALTHAVSTDAIAKLARFAQWRGCAAP